MIWNMRRKRGKKVFTVTLSGKFQKRSNNGKASAELYITINGEDCTDEGVYEVAPNTVIAIFAQSASIIGASSAGTINLNGTKVNQSARYGLKITANAIIKGTIVTELYTQTATADITMPA